MIVDKEVLETYEQAKKAQRNAYAPYSKFHVGAALKIKQKQLRFTGCNVENASFGATVCAERVAIMSSVASGNKEDIDFIVVVTDTDPAIGPCALCLQVMSEFCKPDMKIYFANQQEIQRVVTFGELLPNRFSEIPEQI
ncbi:MAG: cytidine deaminase [Bacteriovoracaceae bacterium]|jgi:homotetrameric cytidine deaminase|nr:cytidine deaminase [Bacteriovoracaceae bacterium]